MRRILYKIALYGGIFLAIMGVIAITEYYDSIGGFWYDSRYENPNIESTAKLNVLLAEYPQVSYNELPENYRNKTGYEENKYKGFTSKMKFYLIPKEDRFRYILGDNRINTLIPKDKSSVIKDNTIILGINKRVLERFMALIDVLEKQGYNPNKLKIQSAYRPPNYNKKIKGAGLSRHMAGEALDINIGDVNRDGHYSEEDKQLVYEICDKVIIGDLGGLGRYPGTRNIHIDVRGHKARWETF